jgi:hypothetical protein
MKQMTKFIYGVLLGLLIKPEDGSNGFLRNVDLLSAVTDHIFRVVSEVVAIHVERWQLQVNTYFLQSVK